MIRMTFWTLFSLMTYLNDNKETTQNIFYLFILLKFLSVFLISILVQLLWILPDTARIEMDRKEQLKFLLMAISMSSYMAYSYGLLDFSTFSLDRHNRHKSKEANQIEPQTHMHKTGGGTTTPPTSVPMILVESIKEEH